jgi:hypothetical protein
MTKGQTCKRDGGKMREIGGEKKVKGRKWIK